MICNYCGNVVDETAVMCPYCGNGLNDDAYVADDDEDIGRRGSARADEDMYADTEDSYEEAPAKSRKKMNFGGFHKSERTASAPSSASYSSSSSYSSPAPKAAPSPLSLASLAAAVLSLICVVMLTSVNNTIKATNNSLIQQVNTLTGTVSNLESSIANLDTTLANVQSEAYQQVASQNITITKDLTSLTGPVTAGKYNVMFILRAKGPLNINTSFDWQKYNESTGGWVPIVFTGTATTNEEFGLRIENSVENSTSEYSTTLWANGITPAAAGSYRCVITDTTGVKKNSTEVTVQVTS